MKTAGHITTLVGAGVVALALAGGLLRAESLPFVDTFEARTLGILSGQGDWVATPGTNVQVQTAVKHAGSRAVVVGKDSLAVTTLDDASATNVWIDFAMRVEPRAPALAPMLAPDSVAGFYFNTGGHIVAYSNAAWVTLGNLSIPTNVWRRFSIHLDYTTREWGIYVADNSPNAFASPVATNLAFNSSVTNAYFSKMTIRN